MKTTNFKKILGGVLLFLLCATFELHAQFRPGGGGGGGFGGFGGFAVRDVAAFDGVNSR